MKRCGRTQRRDRSKKQDIRLPHLVDVVLMFKQDFKTPNQSKITPAAAAAAAATATRSM